MKSIKLNLIALAIFGAAASANAQYRSIETLIEQEPKPVAVAEMTKEQEEKLKKENRCVSNEKSGRVLFNHGLEGNKIMLERTAYSCYFSYNLVYDPVTKTPVFVTQNMKEVNKIIPNFATFRRVDPNLVNYAQPTIDYSDEDLEPMSLAPLEDMEYKFGNGNEKGQAIEEALYFTNTIPVVKGFKDGVWYDIEESIRNWSKERELSVVTGVLFDDLDNPTLYGPSQIWVPTRLYKAVYEPKTGRSIAFVVPNVQIVRGNSLSIAEGTSDYWQTMKKYAYSCKGGCTAKNFITSVKSVEEAAGVKLFPNVRTGGNFAKIAPSYWKLQERIVYQ